MEKIKDKIRMDLKHRFGYDFDTFCCGITEHENFYYIEFTYVSSLKKITKYGLIYDLDGNLLNDINARALVINDQNYLLEKKDNDDYQVTHYHIFDDGEVNVTEGITANFDFLASIIPESINTLIVIIGDKSYLYNMDTCKIISLPFSSISCDFVGLPLEKEALIVTIDIVSTSKKSKTTLYASINLKGEFLTPLFDYKTLVEYKTESNMTLDELNFLIKVATESLDEYENEMNLNEKIKREYSKALFLENK